MPSHAVPLWRNGRRERLKIVCRKTCPFESGQGHHFLLLLTLDDGPCGRQSPRRDQKSPAQRIAAVPSAGIGSSVRRQEGCGSLVLGAGLARNTLEVALGNGLSISYLRCGRHEAGVVAFGFVRFSGW